MKHYNTKIKMLGVLATLGLSLAGALSVSAWGPERDTFTMKEPADHPTFNSITDNPTIGDERDFVRVGEINADVTHLTNEIEVIPGRQYLVYIYFHNNASSVLNDSAHNNAGVAMQARMSSSFSTVLTPSEKGKITATVTANNTTPASVWDEAYMTTKTEKVLLHYVAGSAKIYNDWKANGSVMPSSLFAEEGTLLGLNALNGVIPGCEEYHGVVSYVLQAEELGGSIEKAVSKDGEEFGESVNLAPGEQATYRLTIRNTGDVALTNVVIKDQLPKGLSLVPGSVKLTANDSKTTEAMSDNIFGTGYNLGKIGTGNTVYITYQVVADGEFDCEGTELTNHATMTYDSDREEGETKTATSTITVKKTDCEPPKEDLENCETNPALPECQTPEELPDTGPVEAAVAAVIVMGIGGGGYYFYRTRKTLKTVEQKAVGGAYGSITGNENSDIEQNPVSSSDIKSENMENDSSSKPRDDIK